jgi:hypothetical protein
MSQGAEVIGLYVRDQEKLSRSTSRSSGSASTRMCGTVTIAGSRCSTRRQPSFQLGLFALGPPALDAATVDGCRAAYQEMRARGVEFTRKPVERYGTVDTGFRDSSGNGWKIIEPRHCSRDCALPWPKSKIRELAAVVAGT